MKHDDHGENGDRRVDDDDGDGSAGDDNETEEEAEVSRGRPMPRGRFLNLHVLLVGLEEEAEPLLKVPVGEKEYACLSLTTNTSSKGGRISQFPDDCGAWDTCGPPSKTKIVSFRKQI